MKKKWMICIAIVLVAALAVFGMMNRKNSPQGEGLQINSNGKTVTVSFADLNQTAFEGDLVNGKGEVSHHEYQGVELNVLLSANNITVSDDTVVTATSEDKYSAELSGAEVLEAGKVYIAVTADGEKLEGIEGGEGAQLIVFGDSNSKRAVRYLKVIDIQ
ncbi:MAG: hypothetical protein IKR11_05995 [Solobacterium sp.]|nr:hypothetical protein [Solobacterium sp.]